MEFCQKLLSVLPSGTDCWTVTDFQSFLRFMELEEYGEGFEREGIDGEKFMSLTEEDLQSLGVNNVIARYQLIDTQALLLKYNEFLNSQDEENAPKESVQLGQKSGFLSNSFNPFPNQRDAIQTPELSQNFGKPGGFRFGEDDFFMSGKLNQAQNQQNSYVVENSIKYDPKAVEGEKDGSYEILKSHYHVKDFKNARKAETQKPSEFDEDEELKAIEKAESRIVLRAEIERKPKFNYLNNFSKSALNKRLPESPNKTPALESELKLLNVNNASLAYSVREAGAKIGSLSDGCSITLSSPDIEPLHCEIQYHSQAEGFYIRDLGSKTGTWLKIHSEKPFLLEPLRVYCVEIGQSTYKISVSLDSTSLSLVSGTESRTFKLAEPVVIGKNPSCTISFPKDQCMSKTHCKVYACKEGVVLEDSKSTNGTWIRVEASGMRIEELMQIRVGNQCSLKVLSVFVKETKEGKKCLSCGKEEVKTIIEPCWHVVLCGGCAKGVRACPACGVPIDKIIVTG